MAGAHQIRSRFGRENARLAYRLAYAVLREPQDADRVLERVATVAEESEGRTGLLLAVLRTARRAVPVLRADAAASVVPAVRSVVASGITSAWHGLEPGTRRTLWDALTGLGGTTGLGLKLDPLAGALEALSFGAASATDARDAAEVVVADREPATTPPPARVLLERFFALTSLLPSAPREREAIESPGPLVDLDDLDEIEELEAVDMESVPRADEEEELAELEPIDDHDIPDTASLPPAGIWLSELDSDGTAISIADEAEDGNRIDSHEDTSGSRSPSRATDSPPFGAKTRSPARAPAPESRRPHRRARRLLGPPVTVPFGVAIVLLASLAAALVFAFLPRPGFAAEDAVALSGTGAARNAWGVALTSEESLLIYAAGLSELERGYRYIAWRVEDGGYHRLGAMTSLGGGRARLAVAGALLPEQLEVTIEPSTSTGRPAGPTVLAGIRLGE